MVTGTANQEEAQLFPGFGQPAAKTIEVGVYLTSLRLTEPAYQ
jgi:hypothetical protein